MVTDYHLERTIYKSAPGDNEVVMAEEEIF